MKVNFDLEMDSNLLNNDIELENELFYGSALNNEYKQYYDMITSIILQQYESKDHDEELFLVIIKKS